MRILKGLKIIGPVAALGLSLAVPAFAQESNPAANSSPSAGTQMKSAGDNVMQAGSDTAAAATDVGRGTMTAVKDTTVTARVKRAIHADSQLSGSDIHVSTTAGTVTLKGHVASNDMAAHAEQVAQQTKGVKNVDNKLMVNSSGSANSMQ
jgi:hyperosmotically inducible periplasmic protein